MQPGAPTPTCLLNRKQDSLSSTGPPQPVSEEGGLCTKAYPFTKTLLDIRGPLGSNFVLFSGEWRHYSALFEFSWEEPSGEYRETYSRVNVHWVGLKPVHGLGWNMPNSPPPLFTEVCLGR